MTKETLFQTLAEGVAFGHKQDPQPLFDALLESIVLEAGGTMDNEAFVDYMNDGLLDRIGEEADAIEALAA